MCQAETVAPNFPAEQVDMGAYRGKTMFGRKGPTWKAITSLRNSLENAFMYNCIAHVWPDSGNIKIKQV